MAFSLRSRAGWNRLWVVLAVLWWSSIAFEGITSFPQQEDIDRELELRREWQPQTFDKHSLLRKDAVEQRNKALAELSDRRYWFTIVLGALMLTPFVAYVFIYLLVAIVLWIGRGFSKV